MGVCADGGTAEAGGSVVAFEADRGDGGAAQQFGVHRAVGGVTGFASIDADGGVFKGERATFVAVAFHAGFFVGLGVFGHARTDAHAPSGRLRAVRVVAIRALHEAFVDPMFEGHGELGFHAGVATAA